MTSQTATQQSTIIVEKRDEKNAVVEISPVKSIVYQKPNMSNTNSVDMVAYDKQQVKQPATSENIERTSKTLQPSANISINPVAAKTSTTEAKSAPATEHPQSSVRKQLIKDVPSTSTTSNNNNMSNSSASLAKMTQKPPQPSKMQEAKSTSNAQQQSNKSKPQSNLQTTRSSTSLTANLTDKNANKAQVDNQTPTSQPVNQIDSSNSTRNVIYENRAHKKLKPLSIEKNTFSFAVRT